jgi:predicted O-linked N-acetylglucosamine transferase (SPINDLY family)
MAAGVDPARLIFATRVPRPEDHLARLAQADLFLDTLPYNAHTSAADALRAGVPVLTCAGRSLAARMGASLLTSLDMTELITQSLPEYEQKAITLALDPAQRAVLRSRLDARVRSAASFDAQAYCRSLEAVLQKIGGRL